MNELVSIFIIMFLVIGVFVFFGVWISKITKTQRAQIKNEAPKEINLDEPVTEPVETTVKVIDQSCCAKVAGTKQPKAVNEFIITFEDVDGRVFSLSVPQECYDGFEVGQTGKLSTVNGELFGFELDE